MKNILKNWDLSSFDISNKVSVQEIKDDSKGLAIYFEDERHESKKIMILFENALSYVNTNESYLLKRWENESKENLGKVFYKIDESEYIELFHHMSFNVYKDLNIKHFAIYTNEDCLDVLSVSEPEIEWISS